jgi:hypothetical protein
MCMTWTTLIKHGLGGTFEGVRVVETSFCILVVRTLVAIWSSI